MRFSMVTWDVCVAGGTESCICPTGIAGFTALTALSTNEDPMTASRPFDQDRMDLSSEKEPES